MLCIRIVALLAALLAVEATEGCFTASVRAQAAGADAKAMALRPNVVKITATLGPGAVPQSGFGFIVGQQGSQLVVITADHVVRGDDPGAEDKTPLITFFENQGSQIRGKLETVRLPKDSGDLAVILVKNPGFVSHVTEAIDARPAARGLQVWLIGRAGDWNIPASPGVVAQIDSFTQRLQVEGLAARVGSSGGPLVSADGIVGMIVMDNDLYTEATPIEPIETQVRDRWHYPWQLTAGHSIVMTTPNQSVPSAPAAPCNGNSDGQVTQPVFAVYDAINRRDINLYAAQWAEQATYVRADTDAVTSLAQKISDRRADFARWRSAEINKEKVSVSQKTATTAVVSILYSLKVELPDGRISQDSHVLENYNVRCEPNGKWLIERNVDYVNRSPLIVKH